MATYYDKSIYKTEIIFNNLIFRVKSDISIKGNFEQIVKLSSMNRNKLQNICMHFLSTQDKNILENNVIKNIFIQAMERSKRKNDIMLWINNYFAISEKINYFLLNYDGKELKTENNLIYYL